MKRDSIYIVLIGLIMMVSCWDSPRNNNSGSYLSGDYSSTNGESYNNSNNDADNYQEPDNEATPDLSKIQLTGNLVQCNKCMGYGSVQDGLYGTPHICKFCYVSTYMLMSQGWTGFTGRYGMVDEVFNTLPADYFDGLIINGNGRQYDDNDGGNGLSSDDIEREIDRHERNIEQMERQLDYTEGTINCTYLQQQIIQERYEIKRLQNMLNN